MKMLLYVGLILVYIVGFNLCKECLPGTWSDFCLKCGKCENGTTCNSSTGQCPSGCMKGYWGPKCEKVCHFLTNGNPCNVCGMCSGGCDGETGTCPKGCILGWTGARCDKPNDPNTYGRHNTPCGYCEGGRCDMYTGFCREGCQDRWKGYRCDEACGNNTYGNPCKDCGKCVDHLCDFYTGMCSKGCQDGWTGGSCNQVEPLDRCNGNYEFEVDFKLRSLRSPFSSRGGPCRYYLFTNENRRIYARIYFPSFDRLPSHICKGSYVEISDVSGTIGRYCDENSTLIHSTGNSLFVESVTSGASFDFQILYALKSFSSPDPIVLFAAIQPPGTLLSQAMIIGLCVGPFLFLFITICLIYMICKLKRRKHIDGVSQSHDTVSSEIRTANPAGQQVSNGPVPSTQSANQVYDEDPPPYWSVFSS